jgi:molybdopterin/thiamine biosynthesis adenylyltransferase
LLSRARVLLIGAGGLGGPVAEILTHAGVGALTVVDDDVVDLSNLHRQIVFHQDDVGARKAEALVHRLSGLSNTRLSAICTRFTRENALSLLAQSDFVVDATDSFGAKFLTCDAAYLCGRPYVIAACVGLRGTIFASASAAAAALAGAPALPARDPGACYRCVFEEPPQVPAATCSSEGILGPVAGIAGALAADAVLRALADAPARTSQLLSLACRLGDSEVRVRRRTLLARATCLLCGTGSHRRIRSLDAARYRETASGP